MGQSSSVHAGHTPVNQRHTTSINQPLLSGDVSIAVGDLIQELPDECLGMIFQSLSSGDRKACSVVCRRWFVVEGQSRQRLSLKPQPNLVSFIPGLFSRFDSITKLDLRCDRRSKSLNDEALNLISIKCPKLSRLNLRGCREVTHQGMASLGMNAKCLTKFSCGSCTFGVKGIIALLDHCSSLEELSVKRLRGMKNGDTELVAPGVAGSSLKSIRLKELHNGQCFAPLIIGSKSLRSLKLLRCFGDWNNVVEMVGHEENNLVEVYLDRVQVSDVGLSALSNCLELEILHIIKTPDCTNAGLVSVLEHCKLLRKLHIDGWRTNRIGEQGLMSIGKHSANLQELVLIGVNPSLKSLEAIASGCQKLERLALCGSETVADAELSCIATKCAALKKVCIKSCPVSDKGIEAFIKGCPNLMKIKVKKCSAITSEVEDLLRLSRRSLIVDLDVCELEVEPFDASASDGGTQEDELEFLPMISQEVVNPVAPSSSKGRASTSKPRFGLFGGRCLVARAFKRRSNSDESTCDCFS